MTRYTPLWEQAGSYAASVDRRLIGAIWPAPMVSGCAVTVAAGTMNMNIAAGTVVAPAANNTGAVLCYSDAVEVVTSPAAPAGGTNRYDVVVCQPRGNDLDGGANNDFVFSVVSGTAAASPTVPAVPAGAVALAQVLVVGGSASLSAGNLTDRRPYATGNGTPIINNVGQLMAGARIRGGSIAATTTAGGVLNIPITPALGSVVVTVVVAPGGAYAFIAAPVVATVISGSTTMQVTCYNPTGTVVNAQMVALNWIVIDVP